MFSAVLACYITLLLTSMTVTNQTTIYRTCFTLSDLQNTLPSLTIPSTSHIKTDSWSVSPPRLWAPCGTHNHISICSQTIMVWSWGIFSHERTNLSASRWCGSVSCHCPDKSIHNI